MQFPFKSLFALLACLLVTTHVSAGQLPVDGSVVEEKAQSNAWWRLLHYKKSLRGIHSQIDAPEFFLHPKGHQQPGAELKENLQQLQQALTMQLPEEKDYRCRYPARLDWISRAFSLSVPVRECAELSGWLEQMDAGSLTLIFPAAYLNNAASMFGHSLLRIDSADTVSRPDLVAWAINYAANANPADGGVAYAMKGMFGMYPGYFSLMPYYEKVNEYSNLENRDIWEYPLDVNPQEMQRVLWHLWELDNIRFDYWFFDENCSYQLLALLSVLRDDLDLTHGFDIKALPVDTIRALDEAGLLREGAAFRPSFASELHSMSLQVSADELRFVEQLVFEQTDPASLMLPDTINHAKVYELAYQWLNFRYQHQGLPREQAASQLHQLLLARSKVRETAGYVPVRVPDTAPHQGHGTAQWSVAAGHHERGNYLQIGAKPSYHGRFDAIEGYLPSAEINLLELRLRYYHREDAIEPWHLNLLEVGNYLTSSPVFNMSAWRTQVEIGRAGLEDSAGDDWRSRIHGGYGRAWGDGETLLGYALVTAELENGPQAGVRKQRNSARWATGAGIAGGVVWQAPANIRAGIDLQATSFFAGATGAGYKGKATLQWNQGVNNSLRLQFGRELRQQGVNELELAWLRNF